MIQHQMELHAPFLPVELGPGKEFQTESDGGTVDGKQLIFETKLLGRMGKVILALLKDPVEEIFKEFPAAFFVGVGQRGFLGSFAEP